MCDMQDQDQPFLSQWSLARDDSPQLLRSQALDDGFSIIVQQWFLGVGDGFKWILVLPWLSMIISRGAFCATLEVAQQRRHTCKIAPLLRGHGMSESRERLVDQTLKVRILKMGDPRKNPGCHERVVQFIQA